MFDMLAQHHPEYVSLAWGNFKFVFQVILNHQELIEKIAKGLAQIADLLPRANLSLVLYPADMMQATLARLYAHILRFMQQALLWYRQSKLMHSVSAIVRPWAITYKEQLEAVTEASVRLDKLSDMASKAELRDTRLEVIGARKDWLDAKSELKVLQEDNRRLADMIQNGIGRLDQTIMSLHKEVRIDFKQQGDMLCSMQLNQILSISFLEKLPSSGESLEYCQSIRRRSRHRSQLPLPEVSRLTRWAAEPTSSSLLLRGGSTTVAKAFMIDLVDLVRDAKLPIIWALRFANYWESSYTCIDILRILVLQALQLNPRALVCDSHPITLAHMREAATIREWLSILARPLRYVPRIFIALDTEFLSHVTVQ
ncbi:hypothetical protein MMC18_007290 [Xylographa bjoerkii]|nr:hypothetical protein [Xylographa bjoerkii]